MADDRLFIRCRKCGDQLSLAKIYHHDSTTPYAGAGLQEWLDEHLDLTKCAAWNWGSGPVGFELTSETSEVFGDQ